MLQGKTRRACAAGLAIQPRGSAIVSTDSLQAAALKEAGEYCDNQGRRLAVVHTKNIPAGPLGRWPESEVLFKCEQRSSWVSERVSATIVFVCGHTVN